MIYAILLDIPGPQNPLSQFSGVFKNDPLFDSVIAEIESYRRQLDAEAERDAVSTLEESTVLIRESLL